jgi:hypothetical protein
VGRCQGYPPPNLCPNWLNTRRTIMAKAVDLESSRQRGFTPTCQRQKEQPGAADGLKWDANSHLKFIWGETLSELASRGGVSLSGRAIT